MKIVLATTGSRGDIQPYIALAWALNKKGYIAVVATHPWAGELLDSYGVTHIPVGPMVDTFTREMLALQKKGKAMRSLSMTFNLMLEVLSECHNDFMRTIQDADLVIGHGISGRAEAEILNKPFVTVSISTIALPKLLWKSPSMRRNIVNWINHTFLDLMFGRSYLRFRNKLGVPAITNEKQKYLAIIPASPLIQKTDDSWLPVTEVAGYFFADPPHGYEPASEILDFLSKGEKPVFICFGSMKHQGNKVIKLLKAVEEALVLSGTRAILLMSDSEARTYNFPDSIFRVDNIPYSWLLDKVSMVIHHFGFGTTAETLRAGLPAIPVPHLFDQSIRAKEIYHLGMAHRPLSINRLSARKLAKAIQNVWADEKMKNTCREAGRQIQSENGLERAVQLIEKFCSQ